MAAPGTPERIKDVNERYHDVAAAEYDSKWGIDFGDIGQKQVGGKIRKALGELPADPRRDPLVDDEMAAVPVVLLGDVGEGPLAGQLQRRHALGLFLLHVLALHRKTSRFARCAENQRWMLARSALMGGNATGRRR